MSAHNKSRFALLGAGGVRVGIRDTKPLMTKINRLVLPLKILQQTTMIFLIFVVGHEQPYMTLNPSPRSNLYCFHHLQYCSYVAYRKFHEALEQSYIPS